MKYKGFLSKITIDTAMFDELADTEISEKFTDIANILKTTVLYSTRKFLLDEDRLSEFPDDTMSLIRLRKKWRRRSQRSGHPSDILIRNHYQRLLKLNLKNLKIKRWERKISNLKNTADRNFWPLYARLKNRGNKIGHIRNTIITSCMRMLILQITLPSTSVRSSIIILQTKT